jgi:hypothetical protein
LAFAEALQRGSRAEAMLAGMEESSVLFNLQEIMRLERDRVSAEEAAVRAAHANAIAEREARAREQREQAARDQAAREQAAAERERRALEATQAEETERAAALLRIRLEAEAQQRIVERQLELARAEQLHSIAAEDRKKRASWVMASALIALCLASGAGYAYVLEPALRSARERSAALDRLTADAAAQTEALNRQMQELMSLRATSAGAQAPANDLTAGQVEQLKRRPKRLVEPAGRKPERATTETTSGATALDALDDANNDPLFGLGAEGTPKRKRR